MLRAVDRRAENRLNGEVGHQFLLAETGQAFGGKEYFRR